MASVAWPLINQMNPSADTLAMASIEYDLSKVLLGQEVTIKWRGKRCSCATAPPPRSPPR